MLATRFFLFYFCFSLSEFFSEIFYCFFPLISLKLKLRKKIRLKKMEKMMMELGKAFIFVEDEREKRNKGGGIQAQSLVSFIKN